MSQYGARFSGSGYDFLLLFNGNGLLKILSSCGNFISGNFIFFVLNPFFGDISFNLSQHPNGF